jgi:hypothetical protein
LVINRPSFFLFKQTSRVWHITRQHVG